jgi:heterodisulfide reductase subunit B
MTRFPCDIEITDDRKNPMGMDNICSTLGATPIDWNYKTDCCGASASVNDMDTSLRLMSRMLEDAQKRGANCIVTSCPMCQMNLDAYQNQVCQKYGLDNRLPVYFITELMGVALGLDPKAMQLDRHFIESIKLLKELELI